MERNESGGEGERSNYGGGRVSHPPTFRAVGMENILIIDRPLIGRVVAPLAVSNFTVGIEIRRRGDRSRHVRTTNFEIQPL